MSRAGSRPRTRIAVGVGLVLLASAAGARADEITGYLELVATESETTERIEGVGTAESETRAVVRRLQFSFDRRPYERIRIWAGGTFEDVDPITIQDGVRSDTDIRRIRPYAGIGRRTRKLSLDLLWNRDQTRNSPDGATAPWNVRDQVSATAVLSPDRGPMVRATLRHADDRDSERRFRDQITDVANLDVSQQVGEAFRWSYRGVRTEQSDRISGTDSTANNHRASVSYDDRWFEDRWLWRSEYTVAYRTTEATTSGGGPVDVPVFPSGGLSGRDETPLLITLLPNPALIDDDVTTSAGVNLGLPPPAGDDRAWAIGHEFLQSRTVDTFVVWADRDVRPEVAASFSWTVYVSLDNVEWTPVASLPTAPFDEPRRQWELRFPATTARYVKIVVPPLAPDVPFATEFPELFVTELDAALRTFAPDGRVETTDTAQTLRNDTRARLLRDHEFYYLGNYYLTKVRGRDLDYRLSNGLSYTRPLGPEARVSARSTWETSSDETGEDSALVYTASLAVTPVPRLRYTVSVSGRAEQANDIAGGDQVAVLFYGYATLVDGVEVQVGASRNFQEALDGRTVTSTRVNGTLRVEPRRDLSFGVNYTDSVSERRTVDAGLPDIILRTAEVNATWTPVSSVYLFSSYRREWRTEIARNDVTSLVAGFSPFPGGSLRIALNYNETRRTVPRQTQRTAGPSVRWYVNPRSWISAAYTTLLDEIGPRRVDTDIVNVVLRWGF